MDSNQALALLGAVIIAFVVRMFNVVIEWLSHVLGVEPPDPIPSATDVLTVGAPTSPREAATRPPEATEPPASTS